jgi:hypothetical protein
LAPTSASRCSLTTRPGPGLITATTAAGAVTSSVDPGGQPRPFRASRAADLMTLSAAGSLEDLVPTM